MRHEHFGPLARSVPVVGFGTWQLERAPRQAALAAIRQAVDAGTNHIDTAEMYGSGRVEELVGEALAGRRDEVFLVSKVLPENSRHERVIAACQRSLRRLRTDRVDLYLLHWRGRTPLEETIGAFEKLAKDGAIGAWGVSNFDCDDLEEAIAIAGDGRIACNQVFYHLGDRTIEHAVLPWCVEHGVALCAYSPLGAGGFPGARSTGGKVLGEIASVRGVSPQAVALAFLVRRPGVFAIPKSARAERVRENSAAGDLVLSDEEVSRIDDAFGLGPWRGLPIL